jgi:GAF domain-containing protein/membrane protein implicated in regulation of membrane protease activity
MKLSIFSMNRSPEDNEPTFEPPQRRDAPGGRPSDDKARLMALPELRARILDRIYLATALMGVLTLLANLPSIIQRAEWSTLALFGLLLAGLFYFGFQKNLPYRLRATILIAITYVAGVAVLFQDGLFGSGRVFLVALPFFGALLGERLERWVALSLAILAMIVTGALMITGVVPAPVQPEGMGNASLFSWTAATLSFALITVAGATSFAVMLDGLKGSLEQQQNMASDLENERAALEQRIQQRTNSLERRLVQIRTAAEITRQISRVLDVQVLLPQVCELIRARFNLYYVGVFLLEDSDRPMRPGEQRYLALAAGTGEAGQRMLADRHRLLIGGDSMIGWTAANRQARIALDVGKEAVRFNNPNLPRTRSELALPIVTGGASPAVGASAAADNDWRTVRVETGRLLGAVTVQSDVEAAFDQDDIVVLQGIADGLAAAIENARLFAATQASLEEVSSLHRQYLQTAWTEARSAGGQLAYTFENLGENSAARPTGEEPAAVDAPIHLRDQVIGRLVLEPDPDAPPWTQEQMGLIEAVTTQAALALENARLLEETRRRAEQERAFSRITSQVWSSSNLDTIVRQALQELGASLHAAEGWLELWPGDADKAETPPDQPAASPEAHKEADDVVA